MSKQKTNQIPPPPNDGCLYKWTGGKYVKIGDAQKPMKPASERRAEAEASAKAEAEKSAASAKPTAGKPSASKE